jgi:hypothetical protein
MPRRIHTKVNPIMRSWEVTAPLPVVKIWTWPTVTTSTQRWCLCKYFRESHPCGQRWREFKSKNSPKNDLLGESHRIDVYCLNCLEP